MFKRSFLPLELVPQGYWQRTIPALLGLFLGCFCLTPSQRGLSLPDQDSLSLHLLKAQSLLAMNRELWTFPFAFTQDLFHFSYQASNFPSVFWKQFLAVAFSFLLAGITPAFPPLPVTSCAAALLLFLTHFQLLCHNSKQKCLWSLSKYAILLFVVVVPIKFLSAFF